MGSTKHLAGETDGRSSPLGSGPEGRAPAGPRDENSVVISLSALLAVEEEAAASKASSARSEHGARSAGVVDIQGLSAGGEQERSSYLDLFPFGAPTELPAFRPPDLTPVPSEVPIDLLPRGGRPAAGARWRYGVLGLAGAAVIASAAWLGAPREALHGAAQAGVGHAARAAQARLPKTEAPPVAAIPGAPSSGKQGDKARERAQRGEKARAAAPAGGGGARTAEKRAAASRSPAPAAAAAAAPKRQGGAGAAGDPCNGDLVCAMRRATGGS
ncbi:hypothetical protein SOCE26_068470 [Sorangium cellulosum]|uniref:Uncharacterized protein n=1 Tax=Sorangium cellulosum TaxID=56 RepID=A0A2L0F1C8_SORCE|nr:hypothetical protein [Sorangium cellulosum]AUX45365.1 hypothetical protein SOCE26_068470 [Sorangium cellulosum]